MEKLEKLNLVYDKLVQVGHFLERFLCLANTHNSYFITDQVWTELIPAQVAQDLLNLPLDILARLPGGVLLDDPECNKNSSSNNIISHGKYDSAINGGLSVFELCPVKDKNAVPKWDESLKPCWTDVESLALFLNLAHQNSVPGLDILSHSADVIKNLQKHTNCSTSDTQMHDEKSTNRSQAKLCIDSFMNVKKSHEVHKMAQFCASVAMNSKISQAVEVGCGRAYLASQLALLHGLTVVGVEANSSHAQSAQQRIAKFSQQLPGLLRNAEEDLQAGRKMKRGKHFRSKQRQREARNATGTSTDANGIINDSSSRGGLIENDNDFALERDFNLLFTSSTDIGDFADNEIQSIQVDDRGAVNPVPTASEQLTVDSDIAKLDSNRACVNQEWRKKAKAKKNELKISDNIHLVTAKVTNSTRLDDILTQANLLPGTDNEKNTVAPPRAMLVGLHTCGSLACDILRMFAESDAAGAVCVVGCCYQWMEERFLQSPYYGAGERPNPGFEMDVGFPMSHFLQSRHAQIGRNARLLTASLPMANNRLPEKSMFWRAVLQVILTDITGLHGHNWIVGKMPPSCQTFVEYVQRALTKLELPQLSVEAIEGYYDKYSSFEVKVTAFFQLRGVVARNVEALILLDRLAYVLEQEAVAEAHLVQLFDPVVSPRCYGIVAWKTATGQIHD